jgi:hypothetical protein
LAARIGKIPRLRSLLSANQSVEQTADCEPNREGGDNGPRGVTLDTFLGVIDHLLRHIAAGFADPLDGMDAVFNRLARDTLCIGSMMCSSAFSNTLLFMARTSSR